MEKSKFYHKPYFRPFLWGLVSFILGFVLLILAYHIAKDNDHSSFLDILAGAAFLIWFFSVIMLLISFSRCISYLRSTHSFPLVLPVIVILLYILFEILKTYLFEG